MAFLLGIAPSHRSAMYALTMLRCSPFSNPVETRILSNNDRWNFQMQRISAISNKLIRLMYKKDM